MQGWPIGSPFLVVTGGFMWGLTPLHLPPNRIPFCGVAFGAIFEILTFRRRE